VFKIALLSEAAHFLRISVYVLVVLCYSISGEHEKRLQFGCQNPRIRSTFVYDRLCTIV